MDKRPPLGPNASKNLAVFGALTLVKALALIVFSAVIATALTYMARLTYVALIEPQTYASERAEQLAVFAGNAMAQVDGLWIATFGATPSVMVLATVGLAAALIRGLADFLLNTFAARAAGESKREIRLQLLERVLATGGADTPQGTGATAVLLSRGLNSLDDYYSKTLTALVSSAILPLGLWLVIVFHDWVSGLIIALTIPLIPLFMVLIGKTTREDTARAQKDLLRLSDHIVELVKGLPVLIGLGRNRAQTAALGQLGERYRKTTMFTLRSAFMSSFALELITTISVALVAVFIGVRLVHGTMGLDTALLALLLAPECYQPLRNLGAAYHQSEDGVAALRSARQVLDQPVPQPEPVSVSDRVSVKNLSVTYPDRSPTLTNVYFSLMHGTTTAVIGESGCGKSTLLSVMAGLLADGLVPTGASKPIQVTGSISGMGHTVWVPQSPAFIAPSVEKEVLLYAGAQAETMGVQSPDLLDADYEVPAVVKAYALEILTAVGLSQAADLVPEDLSSGQMRRLAIARAIAGVETLQDSAASTPVTVLIDEPTAHLDQTSAEQVLASLTALAESGATVLVVTHDKELASRCDAVLAANTVSRITTWQVIQQPKEQKLSPYPVQHLSLTDSELSQRAHPAPKPNNLVEDPPAQKIPLFQTLRQLKELTGISLKTASLPIFLSVLTVVAGVSLTALSGWLIVRSAEQPAMMYLMIAVVGVRFFGIGRAAARYAERLRTHHVVLLAGNNLRIRAWESAGNTVPSIRSLLRGDQILDRLVGDIDELRDALPRVILPIASHAVVMLLALSLTLFVAPTALPAVLIAVIISTVVIPWIVVRADRATEISSRAATSQLLKLGSSALDAAPDVHANGVGGTVLAAYAQADRAYNRATQRGANASGLGQGLTAFTWYAAAIGAVVLSWSAIRAGDLSAPMVSIVVLMCTGLLESSDEHVEAVRGAKPLAHLTQRIAAHTLEHNHQEAQAAITEPGLGGGLAAGELLREQLINQPITLELHRIAARWPKMKTPVFHNVTGTVESGKWLGITGPSGSGKTTALATLLGFLPVESGKITVNSQELAEQELRGFAAWCPQSSYIFESTIANNLALARTGKERPSTAEMLRVLDRVGLGSFIHSLPQGLDTSVGAGGSYVSGGQRQRIAIARTLLTQSPLLLLDEPTAHLDEEAAQALMNDLAQGTRNNLEHNPALVLVSHRPQDIERCDTTIELSPLKDESN